MSFFQNSTLQLNIRARTKHRSKATGFIALSLLYRHLFRRLLAFGDRLCSIFSSDSFLLGGHQPLDSLYLKISKTFHHTELISKTVFFTASRFTNTEYYFFMYRNQYLSRKHLPVHLPYEPVDFDFFQISSHQKALHCTLYTYLPSFWIFASLARSFCSLGTSQKLQTLYAALCKIHRCSTNKLYSSS